MSVGLRLTSDLHVGAYDREARHVVLHTALAAHHQHQNLVREFSL